MKRLGIIGCGGRMTSLLPHIEREGLTIAAVADPRVDDMREKFSSRGYMPGLYSRAEDMLAAESLDGIMIGTRCSLHTPLALLAASANVPIFLEKPVSTSFEQLDALSALLPMSDRIVVSFPLRVTPLATEVKRLLDSGEIGRIEHVEAWNNVPYARGYYKKWYRDDNETGGLFLQKSTHDLDLLAYLIGDEKPIRLAATESKRVFIGDMPAGQTCADCERADECPESPKNLELAGEPKNGEFCCFAVDTGNHDSASLLIEYESGLHAVYTQDFIVRKSAGSRGVRLIGYKGMLEFDFATDSCRLVKHFEKYDETVKVGASGGHGGGDARLIANFAGVVRGEEKSKTPLTDGIASARLCLSARESAEKHIFVEI